MGRDKHDIFDVRLDLRNPQGGIYYPPNCGWMTGLYNSHFYPPMGEYFNINAFMYWQRALFERCKSTFDIYIGGDDEEISDGTEDMPQPMPQPSGGDKPQQPMMPQPKPEPKTIHHYDEIYNKRAIDILYYELFLCGFVGFFKPKPEETNEDMGLVKDLPVIFQPVHLYDWDVLYRPITAVLANPKLKEQYNEMVIGEDIEILQLTPDYGGIWDTILYYAEKLAMMDASINMSIINSRYSKIIGAKDHATAMTIKQMLADTASGKPNIVYNTILSDTRSTGENASPFQIYDAPNLKSQYITDMQIQDFQSLLNMFDSEVGIPTAPYEKKERMVVDEANSKQQDAVSRHQVWMETLRATAEDVNRLFPELPEIQICSRFEESDSSSTDTKDNEAGIDDSNELNISEGE